MNWTEGALARHSRRKGWDKDAGRQKEYFAKARARKHESSTKKTLNPSAFIPGYVPQPRNLIDQSPSSASSIRNKSSRPRKGLIHQHSNRIEKTNAVPERSTVLQLGRSSNECLNEHHSSPQQEPLSAKRRRLLEKSDWTGVNLQKPVVVDFSWQREHALRHGRRREEGKPPRRSDPPERQLHQRKSRIVNGSDLENRRNDDAMRLRIGSQSLRWSRASNSIRSPTSHRGRLPTFEAWKSQQDQLSSPRLPLNSSSINEQLPRVARHYGKSSVASPTLSNWASFANGSQLSSSSSGFDPPQKRRKVSDDPRIIIRSSPPMIHHPQPTRGTRLALFDIRSPDYSETASSTRAHVGIPDTAPGRICREDQKWNSWLDPTGSVDSLQKRPVLQQKEESQHSSPGISQYWEDSKRLSLPSLRSPQEVSTEQTLPTRQSSAIVISSDSSSDVSDEEEFEAIPSAPRVTSKVAGSKTNEPMQGPDPAARHIDPVKELPKHTSLFNELILPSAPQLPKAPNVQDLMDLLIEEEKFDNGNNTTLSRKEEEAAEDENEIWKKFVFDDDIPDIKKRALDEAQQQTTQDLCQAIADTASNFAEPPSTIREQTSPSPGPVCTPELGLQSNSLEEQLLTSSEALTTETTNSVIAQASSPTPQPDTDFKFHPPTLFVGRLASTISTNVNFASPSLQQGKRGRGRPRRRRIDGRPDFRAMPDFDGDPIEES